MVCRSAFALAFAFALSCTGGRPTGSTTAGAHDRSAVDGAIAPVADVPIAAAPTGRLGDTIEPREYWLDLDVDPADATYAGRVRIEVALTEPASSLWMHGRNLTIGAATLTAGAETLTLTQLESDAAGDLLGFGFGKTLAAGTATLDITFAARFGKVDGAFVQTYDDRRYLYTDFEPIDARAALPCFDEPRFKTPWSVSLLIPKTMQGYSNAPLASQEQVGTDHKKLTFARTRPLPSYLVAFAAGPFDEVDAGTDPVPMRMIVPKGKADWGAAAATMAPEILRLVASYAGDEIPFDKIDLIAVPEFNGAMENPGLITVAARILLEDPAGTSIEDQRLLALVHAHEYAHLWFGDLVTLDYWDELWLNEGFATWMADKTLAAWRPDRGTRVDEVISKGEAMALDSTLAARQVRQPITSDADIRAAFDAITYKKGGALFGMLEAWVGEQPFRRAVRAYLRGHADSAVTTADLVAAIREQTGVDATDVLSSFVDQNGIPLIEATITCDAEATRVTLSQRRYLYAGTAQRADEHDTERLWSVPVCLRFPTASGTGEMCTVLRERIATVELPADGCPAWVYPNADANGYYRYDMANDALLELAESAPLNDREMTELAAHTVDLVRSGDISAPLAMKIVEHLAPRANRLATVVMIDAIAFIANHMVADSQRGKLARYVDRVFGKAARDLGIDRVSKERDDDTLLRPVLIGFVGRYGADKRLARKLEKAALAWLTTPEGLPVEMARPVLSAAASQGDAALFDEIVAAIVALRQTAAPSAEVMSTLVTGLGSFRDKALVIRALDMATDSRIGPDDVITLMTALGDTATKRQLTLDYFADHMVELMATNRGRYVLLGPLFDTEFCTPEHAATMESILDAVVGAEHELRAQLVAHLYGSAGNCSVVKELNEAAVGDYLE